MNKKSPDDRKMGQGYVDLKKKTLQELRELLARQDAIIKNRKFIMSLADKGGKILVFKSCIEQEIENRTDEADTCALLAGLRLEGVEELEWRRNGNQSKEINSCLDSDDESDCEVDPLKLIATHSGTVYHARKERTLQDEPSLITAEDLHSAELCRKYGDVKKGKAKFKLHEPKTQDSIIVYTKSGHKVKQRLGDHWEVTSATPPVPVYGAAGLISITESLQLQKDQAHRLKEIEKKQAADRLSSMLDMKMGDRLPVSNMREHRLSNVLGSRFEGSVSREEANGNSEEDEEKGGREVVFYNLVDSGHEGG